MATVLAATLHSHSSGQHAQKGGTAVVAMSQTGTVLQDVADAEGLRQEAQVWARQGQHEGLGLVRRWTGRVGCPGGKWTTVERLNEQCFGVATPRLPCC